MLGAIIGDTIGSIYEFNNVRRKDVELFDGNNFLTDDSIMTLAIGEIIQKRLYNDKNKIIETIKRWGRAYPNRGYGCRFNQWLNSEEPKSYRSYGNGAAMRISAVGFYARDEEEVIELSRLVTEVTHSHPEGLKGAEITAMCIYYARKGKSKEFIKDYVSNYYDINFNYEELKRTYYFNETCQETVPQAIYCFLISKDFEDCVRTTISIGGDTDTLLAISCAIAEAYYKEIDEELINKTLALFPKPSKGCNPIEIIYKYLEDRTITKSMEEEINEDTLLLCTKRTTSKYERIFWSYSKHPSSLIDYLLFYDLDANINEDDDLLKDLILERILENYIDNNKLITKYKLDLLKALKSPSKEELINLINLLNKIYKDNDLDIEYILFDKYQNALKHIQENYNEEGIIEELFDKEYTKNV